MVRVLELQRELMALPRAERAPAYLKRLASRPLDTVVPLVDLNPMAQTEVAAAIDGWLAIDAERTAEPIVAKVNEELDRPKLAGGLVVLDDVTGGRLGRDRTDFRLRFDDAGAVRRGVALAPLWATEVPRRERLPMRLRAALYRIAYQQRHGMPLDLDAMLRQEGHVLRYAGWSERTSRRQQLEARNAISRADPGAQDVAFTLFYGDEAGRQLNYEPMGIVRHAAFDVAAKDAGDPAEALA